MPSRHPHRRRYRARGARSLRQFRAESSRDPSSHVSGSSSAGAYVTISPARFGNVTRSSRNSHSHWRQPPHGDAVIPIASRSPGRQPVGDGARDRRLLRADPERIRRVLDVHALERAPVARQHDRADEVVRVRRVRPRRHRARPLDELLAAHANTWNNTSVTSAPSRPPYATSSVECTPDSTRVCATSSAMMNVRLEIRNRCSASLST